MVLLSKFLFWAQKEEGQFQGAFKTTEREFESVFENALDTILILDDQGICREANPAAEQLFGVRRQELIGNSLDRFCQDSGQFRQTWKLLLVQRFHQGDAEFMKNDRSPVFVEFTAKADCLPGQHVMILRDVTERRRTQLSLLESEERFQQMARNIQEIFWMIDAETKKALFVNPAYETITGHSCESLRDSPTSYEDLIHPDERTHVLTKLDEATRTGQFNEKFRILCAQGATRWVWVRGFPVRDASGRILRLVGTALEITAQKEAEEQVAANLALAKSAWAEAEALRKATLSLTQDLRMDFVMDAPAPRTFLYTIGHSTRPIEETIAILQNYAINSTTVTINGANITNANISLIPTVPRGKDAWHSAGYNLPLPYSASWIPATLAQKNAILYNDSNIWETKLTTGHDQYDDQLYRFNVMQPANEVKNLTVKWIGHGEN
ncbi:MAG: PAS domain S-box protein, partial [Acidobacteriia bacterium]|nr:PAS domain S-box protein [Terriglobia bacterium]